MSNTTDFEKVLGKKNANLGEAIMNNKANLGKSLKEQLTDAYDKFSKWNSESQIILNLLKNVKETANTLKELDDAPVELLKVTNDTVTTEENDKYSFVDSFEIDLRNNTYFDVSKWEGNIKPVKAILSICIPENTTLGKNDKFDVKLSIGNIIFLMEDGTFRTEKQ